MFFLIIGTLIVIVTAFVTYFENKKGKVNSNPHKEKRFSIIYFVLTIAGSLTVLASGIFSKIDENNTNRLLHIKQIENKIAQDSIKLLQNELLNNITGGGAVPIVFASHRGNGVIRIDIGNYSKYPINDVSTKYFNINRAIVEAHDQVAYDNNTGDFRDMLIWSDSINQKYLTIIPIGTLYPDEVKEIYLGYVPNWGGLIDMRVEVNFNGRMYFYNFYIKKGKYGDINVLNEKYWGDIDALKIPKIIKSGDVDFGKLEK